MSSTKKTIVVVGATGNQGSSVARTFLPLPNWHVRCITRNPASSAAQALSSLGAEVVQADLSDIDSLKSAFRGAHAIFVNTDFWGPYGGKSSNNNNNKTTTTPSSQEAFDTEVQHGKNAAIAAASSTTLERFVYSALAPMRKHSKGKYPHSYHWDSKATIVEFIENEQPELAKKTSLFYCGAFVTNPLFMPSVLDAETGVYQFVVPMARNHTMPMIDPRESTGPFVQALIETEEPGVKLLGYDDLLTLGEYVDCWSEAAGKPAELVEVTAEYMNRDLGVPIEVLDAPGYIHEYGYVGGVNGAIEPHQLKVRPRTRPVKDWLKEQDWDNVLERRRKEMEAALGDEYKPSSAQ